jgi:predicted RNase H-like HicB family nuclease
MRTLAGGFGGEVPALPGCYSEGETVEELKHNIREAITGVLDVLKEQGREPDSKSGFWTRRFEIDHRPRNVPVD